MTDSSTRGVFDVAVTSERGVQVVAVSGDVDMISARALADSAYDAAAATEIGLVIDLSEVTFLSSSGITVLLRTLSMLGDGATAALVAPHPAVTRPIALSGLDREVQSYPDRPAAVDSVRRV